MYSASGDEVATRSCFFESQAIGLLFNNSTEPFWDFRSALSFAQSESVYSSTNAVSVLVRFLYVRPSSLEYLMNLIVFCNAL